MRASITTSPLVILVKISIIWAIDSSTCGQLPVYNTPHLTHSQLTHRWPWHAAIFHRHIDAEPTYECGGTVVSRDWILTAAHCVSTKSRDIVVALGRLNLAADESLTEQSFNVTTIVEHEKYEPTNYENDIALVRLSHTAFFNNFVRAICLWNPNQTDLYYVTKKFGTVVGWGTNERFELSNELQEAHFRIVSNARCLVTNRDFYGYYLTETNFCAGLRNGTSVCKGDSGGSMTFEQDGSYYIRGIVSSSPSKINYTTQQMDCNTMEYSIYTDVAMYLQWIIDKIGIECQAVVRCTRSSNPWGQPECNVDVHPTQRMCRITFDESSPSTIQSLSIVGEFETIPDLSDAITKFENLVTLRLNNIKLNLVERMRLSAFRRVQQLDLSDDEITHLEADTFVDLKQLRELYLNNNTITELPDELFEDLNNLKIIQLNDNKLTSLPPGLFRDNQQLQRITLSGNLLKELHVDLFKGLNKLDNLYLHENQIEELPPGLFRDNHNLDIIQLNDNKLTSLPPGLFRDNQQLQRITLSGNLLKELHVDLFKGLNKLDNLYLHENQIEELPPGLFRDNHNLDIIQLNDNKLTSLPPGLFRDNQQLQRITLSGNLLKELHVDLFKGLNKLDNLYLHGNQIENLPPGLFRDNQNLQIIVLDNNQLKKIESDFSHLSKLRALRLNWNVCIDEHFIDLDASEINNKIRTKCSN